MVEGEKKSPSVEAVQSTAKQIYTSPRLVEYGNIAKLTQNGAGSGVDGGMVAGMMMMCL